MCQGPCDDGPCVPEARWEMAVQDERIVTVLYGTVIKAEALGDGDCYADVTFRVKKMWKGTTAAQVTLRTGKPCARPWPFGAGRRYLVSAVTPHLAGWPPEIELCRFPPLEEDKATPIVYRLDQLESKEKRTP
jgi:hypothetical protein